MKNIVIKIGGVLAILTFASCSSVSHHKISGPVADEIIAAQRAKLAIRSQGKGFGPQSPRDIDAHKGVNEIIFSLAPKRQYMNLCNIHFHKNAEHKGGEFTVYAGNGDGHGYQSGYKYSKKVAKRLLTPVEEEICPSSHGGLSVGDTIEVHYVYSTAQVQPGPTLGSCLNESVKNPSLRVEGYVFVLVNDDKALDFQKITTFKKVNQRYQAVQRPRKMGRPVSYIGSTTGPGYNEVLSPFQVTWSVYPKVRYVNIKTVGKWCKKNIFQEDHAHGVRNLVTNPKLLSKIK